MTDRLFRYFFGFLLVFCAVTIFFLIGKPPADINGVVHESHSSMMRSGSTALWDAGSKWFSVFYGLCVLASFLFALWIGGRKHNTMGPIGIWVVCGFIVYTLIFLILTHTWWNTAAIIPEKYFGGFPPATAWMIYGMWFFPFIFLVIYLIYFRSWIYTSGDEARFQQLLKNRRE